MSAVRHSAVLALLMLVLPAAAQQWVPLGPDGGDVRTLTRDPHTTGRVLLSTSSGLLYESTNDGRDWRRLARLGPADNYVIDAVIFHPARPGVIYAAAWNVEDNQAGDVFRSLDDGRTWRAFKDMHGKSVRAMAMAPSNPEVLVAGALDGVFRTTDGGDHWNLISPPGHADLRNIESIAIDPLNPDGIYAGTWHLPWKTSDGGATWNNIKNGVIDDSDVFSIIIDPKLPNVVYASACSGIYKSETGGTQFKKVQGIPYAARRTRVLQQDPLHRETVYAGTTEGLWKTTDGGSSWRRMTPANVIINDVLLDPADPDHVMLATDRSGVLRSEDGGASFVSSSRGFAHRQVTALMADVADPNTFYAGVVNDKEYGGVFVSRDAGQSWKQLTEGLGGLDVFALSEDARGRLYAGTNRGIYQYALFSKKYQWKAVTSPVTRSVTVPVSRKKSVTKTISGPPIAARIHALEIAGDLWFAATAEGMFRSTDLGKTWQAVPLGSDSNVLYLDSREGMIVAATRKTVYISHDRGATFTASAVPNTADLIRGFAIDNGGRIYLASRGGGYRSADGGRSWEFLGYLPVYELSSVVFDPANNRLLVSAALTTDVYESTNGGDTWSKSDTGWLLRSLHSAGGRLIATTPFDGIVAQPLSAVAGVQAGTAASTRR